MSVAWYVRQVVDDPTLYLVANRTEAVFYTEGRDRKFRFAARLRNETGRLHESKLVSDKPGKGVSSAGHGVIRHGLDRRVLHHETIARTFARRIATELSLARAQRRFQDLILVAEPHFLGMLKQALDPQTRGLIRHQVGHEYTQGSDAEVHRHIRRAIWAA